MAVFEVDNEFHESVSQMGHNPLVDQISRVVRMLTHTMLKEKKIEKSIKRFNVTG